MNSLRLPVAAMILSFVFLSTTFGAPAAPADPAGDKIRVLVVTGGHGYEKEPFVELFQSMAGIEPVHVEHPAGGNAFVPKDKPQDYTEGFKHDVIVLYDLWQPLPEQARENFLRLLGRGKGLVVLHHALADYQAWAEFEKIAGGRFFLQPAPDHPASGFREGVDVDVEVADPRHPITAGISPFRVHDEVYSRFRVLQSVHPLLTTNHPESGKVLAWAHRYANARVATVQLGHGPPTYKHPSYRRLLHQAIRWAAGVYPSPEPDRDGCRRLFDGRTLDGWVVMGRPDGFAVRDGVIRSEGGKGGLWLRSARQYEDFELEVEWRVSPNGNSGVFVRCTEDSHPWETGSEIQISNEPRDDSHCTGSVYGVVAVNPRPDESAEKWHRFQIRCAGPRITVTSDGVKVVEADGRRIEKLGAKPTRGYVGLQDSHAPAGSWIEYRNIRLKELPRAGASSD